MLSWASSKSYSSSIAADDLPEHVLDRHESGDAAVFIHDDRHVVARSAELRSSTLSRFDSGNETAGCRASRAAKSASGLRRSRPLGERQDADDVVLLPSGEESASGRWR